MRNLEVDRKPTKNGKVAPGVPVKPSTIAKIRDFFRRWQESPMQDRPELFRSFSDTAIPYVRTVYYDEDDNEYSTSDDEYGDSPFVYPDIPPGHFGVLVGVTDQV
jgi:hypothetical protein